MNLEHTEYLRRSCWIQAMNGAISIVQKRDVKAEDIAEVANAMLVEYDKRFK